LFYVTNLYDVTVVKDEKGLNFLFKKSTVSILKANDEIVALPFLF
jgi:hypothetical protein